jgi:hypothetical protein
MRECAMREEIRVPLNLQEEHGRSLDAKGRYTVSITRNGVGIGSTCRI